MTDKPTADKKPNYSETSFCQGGSHFKVTNWYTLRPLAGEATVELNGIEIAKSQKIVAINQNVISTTSKIKPKI